MQPSRLIFVLATIAMFSVFSFAVFAADTAITLRLLGNGDSASADGRHWNSVVQAFRAANSNLKVIDELLFDEAYHARVSELIAKGEPPAVACIFHDENAAPWQKAGLLVDQRPFIDSKAFDLAHILPQGSAGEIWALPLGGDTLCSVLFVNNSLLKKYGFKTPRNWSDITAMAADPRPAKDGIAILSLGGEEDWVWTTCLLGTLVARFSGEATYIRDTVAGRHRYTDQAWIDSFNFMTSLIRDHVISPSALKTDNASAMELFVAGKALFTIDGQWQADSFENPAFQRVVSMIPLPVLPGEKASMAGSVAASGNPGYGITKAATANPAVLAVAKKFLALLNNQANTRKRWEDGLIAAPLLLGVKAPDSLNDIASEQARLFKSAGPLTDLVETWLPENTATVLNKGILELVNGKVNAAVLAARIQASAAANGKS